MTAVLELELGAPRVLVVWCPDWPVVATSADLGADGGTEGGAERPVAVLESGRVLACSAAARAAGVRRGQRLRLAQRLCPELEPRDRDEEAETRRFEPVIAAVEAFTPRVEVLRPGMCAIPVKGPSRYFGGEDALAAQVHEAVAAALEGGPGAPSGRIGVAGGLFAAVLAARAGALVPAGRTAGFLAPYPVAALGDEPLAELLVRLGVHTVGAFAGLSGQAVSDRFGPVGTAAHRRARGLRSRPLMPRPEGPDLGVEQLFDPPEPLAEPLVFVARSLAERLHTRLGSAGLTCHRVAVEVTCADGRTAARLWRHEDGLGASALAERVRWQLHAWQSAGTFADGSVAPADSAEPGGFTALRLVPDGLVPDQGRQLALWGQAVAEDRVERAAARVQAVLGHAGLCRAEPVGGRGPAEQLVRVPWGEAYERPAPAPWPGRLPEPSPHVVPRTPAPVTVQDAAGRPVTVSGRAEVSAPPDRLTLHGRGLAVTGWTGPWPAVEYWWDPARRRRRARFQVVLADGRALLLTVEGGHWSVEAAYD
ncbi:DNA polymerase Y family protein [Kitasatospora sp. MAP5-34]|uniref:DNA polymerase Y family protein n=1 Tax=Kitasatospora sp. MAP5-34 TaxID=3035102 RepID=UPI002476E3F4|nr:DNA polymerase Y family protein [Kitasatospora sp. MAP5-34]MDH6576091.1 protein ImuB [Kitasatospora sp. MAP5-34]